MKSPLYMDIRLYRAVMTVLYRGGYRDRFRSVLELLDGAATVCELCFGDTILAEACRDRGIRWTGVDINPGFCARAGERGFPVVEGDVLEVELPAAEAYVMAGSLYHFHDRLGELLDRVFEHTSRFVLSEPVRNLSSTSGPLGWTARRLSDPGDGGGRFRYDEEGLRGALEEECGVRGLSWRVEDVGRDLLAVLEEEG